MNAPKPCPFCGETQVYVREEYRFAEYDCAYLPMTYTCGCESDMCPAQPTVADTYTSEEEAIKAWNTRAERTCRYVGDDISGGCSECHGWLDPACSYCPSCGAKVVGE